jgi:3-oxoacyl-[acyl-carrier-protein] synthase II
VVLCGASEDLSSPYVRAMLLKGGARTGVFGQEETGDFAEGAAFMVLESYDRARARGANILCEVSGFADHFSSRAEDAAAVLEQNTRAVIGEARQDHLLLLDGGFQAEADNLRQEVGNVGLHLASSRATHGQMFAVSGVMETVLAARELRRGAITARSFAAGASNTPVGRVLVRRLGKQGSVSTLGLSAL